MTIETTIHRLALREAATLDAVPLLVARKRQQLQQRLLAAEAAGEARPPGIAETLSGMEAESRRPAGIDRTA